MSKISASDGEEKKMVLSDTYRSGYVTSDDESEIPNYQLRLQNHNDIIVDIDVVYNEYFKRCH